MLDKKKNKNIQVPFGKYSYSAYFIRLLSYIYFYKVSPIMLYCSLENYIAYIKSNILFPLLIYEAKKSSTIILDSNRMFTVAVVHLEFPFNGHMHIIYQKYVK